MLRAEVDFGRTKQIVALSDIMVDAKTSVSEAANGWAVFPRNLRIATSIATHGMKNPVIVLRAGEKYQFVASGACIQYAVINGYTHIDAIVLDDEAQVRPLMIEQAQTEQLYLEPQYIHEWWKEAK